MTPSHVAAAHGEVDVLAFLLGHDANANEVDEENRTPLALVLGILSKPTPCMLAWNNDFYFKVCSLLLEAQAEIEMSCHAHPLSKSISQGAPLEIQNLLSLHSQIQCLGRRCHIDEVTLTLICGFQFETAVFVVSLVEQHTTTPQAAAIELRALVTSDLIRSRDLVQRLGNRLSKRLKALDRRAVDALVALGPDACALALEMWQLEEKSPGFFIALNRDPPPPPLWNVSGVAESAGCVASEGDPTQRVKDDLTGKFLCHLQNPAIQDAARQHEFAELLFHSNGRPNRRDDTAWKREVDRRINILLERERAPLQRRDFDFRVRRFLHEFGVFSSIARVSEALGHVEEMTARKCRDEVRSWPAYLATLLRNFDPKLHESLAERDCRSRLRDRRGLDRGPEDTVSLHVDETCRTNVDTTSGFQLSLDQSSSDADHSKSDGSSATTPRAFHENWSRDSPGPQTSAGCGTNDDTSSRGKMYQ